MTNQDIKILIIGQNSFVAKYFIQACVENEIDYYACSHFNIPKILSDFNWVVNFTINPNFFTQKHTTSIDQDALIAKRVSAYKNLKYVMISSRLVYGYDNILIPASEEHELQHVNNVIYGSNKILSEKFCRLLIKPQNLLITRGSNMFGYEIKRKSFIGIALNRLLSKSEILLDISEKTVRDFIPVNDFASYLIQLISKNCTGIYNIGSGKGVTLEDLCNSIIKGYGKGILNTTCNAPIKDQFILDNQKLFNITKRKIKKSEIMNYAKNIGKRLKMENEANKNNV